MTWGALVSFNSYLSTEGNGDGNTYIHTYIHIYIRKSLNAKSGDLIRRRKFCEKHRVSKLDAFGSRGLESAIIYRESLLILLILL